MCVCVCGGGGGGSEKGNGIISGGIPANNAWEQKQQNVYAKHNYTLVKDTICQSLNSYVFVINYYTC